MTQRSTKVPLAKISLSCDLLASFYQFTSRRLETHTHLINELYNAGNKSLFPQIENVT